MVTGLGLALLLVGDPALQAVARDGEGTTPGPAVLDSKTASSDQPDEAAKGIAYDAEIVGVEDSDLRSLLEQTSQLISLKDKPPTTIAGLRRRTEADIERFQTALRSEGYYAGSVDYRVDQDVSPVRVTVEVSPGPRYRLTTYTIDYRPPAATDERLPSTPSALGIKIGMPARAPDVVAAEGRLIELLGERGHPLAKVIDRRTVVDNSKHTMEVTLQVDPGPLARFGPVAIEGLTGVKESYVRRLTELPAGKPYDQRDIAIMRSRLINTNLFEAVRIDRAANVDDQGRLPITVQLTESKHRSVGAGIGYSTDEGIGGSVSWEHRNLNGRNELLRFSIMASQINQEFSADFQVPNFRRLDQTLIFNAAGTRQTTDAFDELSIAFFGGLERRFGRFWTVQAGPSLEYSLIDDNIEKQSFYLAGLPISAARDSTGNLLNPTRGTRLNLGLTPYTGFGTKEGSVNFLVSEVAGSAYWRPFGVDWLVLAGRSRVGSIVGEPTELIPANKRFYAGGGGSIRGYKFQSVGPLDADDDPLGGRSVFEISLETRFLVTESIGIVPFIDGGTVFEESYPDFSETLRWGAGIGLRYYTAIGPLRADIAFPLNPGDDDEDAFQFYISLGQAF